MVTRYPGATWRPLGRQTEPRMRAHDIVCLHTMVGSLGGTDSMFHDNGYGGTESHFGIGGYGENYQWQDLDYQADANLDGNHHVISIETADHGAPFVRWSGENVPAWTSAQINEIVDTLVWLCRHYNIPPVLIPDTRPGRRGIGYHRQGIEPWKVDGGEEWSSARGKICPGDKRIYQLTTIVIPRVRRILGATPPPGRDVTIAAQAVLWAAAGTRPNLSPGELLLTHSYAYDAHQWMAFAHAGLEVIPATTFQAWFERYRDEPSSPYGPFGCKLVQYTINCVRARARLPQPGTFDNDVAAYTERFGYNVT